VIVLLHPVLHAAQGRPPQPSCRMCQEANKIAPIRADLLDRPGQVGAASAQNPRW
jgi:hypothetical protein